MVLAKKDHFRCKVIWNGGLIGADVEVFFFFFHVDTHSTRTKFEGKEEALNIIVSTQLVNFFPKPPKIHWLVIYHRNLNL
jgi:hypothetical protein